MNGTETTSSSGFTSQLNSSLSRNFSAGQPGSSSPISNPQQQTDEIKSEIKNLTGIMIAEFSKMNENLKNQNLKVDENAKLIQVNKTKIFKNEKIIQQNSADIANLQREQMELKNRVEGFNILNGVQSQVATLSDYKRKVLWSKFVREKREFRDSVQTRFQQGHLRLHIQKPDKYLLNHLTYVQENEQLKVNVEKLEEQLKISNNKPIKITIAQAYATKNEKFHVEAYIRYAARGRKELTKQVMSNRSKKSVLFTRNLKFRPHLTQ